MKPTGVGLPADGEVRRLTIAGVRWSFLARATTQAITFGAGIMLARLLSPEAFGLFGMIAVFNGFAGLFIDLGFGAALVQRRDLSPQHCDSVFWFTAAVGLLLSMTMAALASIIAAFYGAPALVPLTVVLSMNLGLSSLAVVPGALLHRRMEFGRLAFIDISVLLASAAVAVGLAVGGCGVWSLVGQSLSSTVLGLGLLWHASAWHPRGRPRWGPVKELLHFSGHLFGFTSYNYCVRNVDNLIIGRVLGPADLGLYSKAYSIIALPVMLVSHSATRVLFPALSAMASDPERTRKAYLRLVGAVAVVTFPMMIGLLVVSDQFVVAVFGPAWVGMTQVLKIFCLVGLIESIGTLNGTLYLSQGRTDLQLKVQLVVGSLAIAAFVCGVQWGVKGVAYAYAAYSAVVTAPTIHIAGALVGVRLREVARECVWPLVGAGAMGTLVATVGWLIRPYVSNWAYLAVTVCLGIAAYVSLLRALMPQVYAELMTVVRPEGPKRCMSRA